MKHELLKRVSKIHSVKCNKSSNYNEAISSYIKLTELAENIRNVEEENDKSTVSINSKIEFWRTSQPIVNENEI